MYNVYLVELLGFPRNHHRIFVELDADDGTGYVFHVTGDIQTGMTYETKPGRKPEETHLFVTKTALGRVDPRDYGRVDIICRSVPPPKKQFEGAKRLYPREPLVRCQEWAQQAVQALKNEGVLCETGG